jgi:two-component system, NarL family, sensor histidine kinase DegS
MAAKGVRSGDLFAGRNSIFPCVLVGVEMRSDEPSTGNSGPIDSGNRQGRLRASSAIDLQERERVRIGFDLHDGPAQTMSAALLQVRMLQDVEGEELAQGLDELRSTLSVALKEIYALIEELGGRDSETTDLVTRIRSCVDGFSEQYGIAADLTVEGTCGDVTRSLQIATFRIVQEALSNVGRHSEASRVHVSLQLSPDEFRCEVSDDGRGFSPADVPVSRRSREAFGLRSMSERARLLDGECTVESAPGEGTRVRVRIPVWQG